MNYGVASYIPKDKFSYSYITFRKIKLNAFCNIAITIKSRLQLSASSVQSVPQSRSYRLIILLMHGSHYH